MNKPKAIQFKHPQSWPSFNPINHGSDNFIGGGVSNVTCSNTCFSSVVGGLNNTNSGSYSTILGGNGNNIPTGIAYAGIFGCNIGAGACSICVQPHTFHTECLQACSTPNWALGYPQGTISFICVTPAMIAIGFPAFSCIAMIS